MPADSDTDSKPARSRRMRADAQRNRAQILRAAREVFADQGPDAPLDEIARTAGVGIATLYRRFPERDDLIREVAVDVLTALAEAVHEAEATHDEPFEALRRFMHSALDLKVGAVMPALAGRIVVDEVLDGVSLDAVGPVQALLLRARAAGRLRPDVEFGDIALAVARLSRPLLVMPPEMDEAMAHRQLDVYIDGLHTRDPARPDTALPGPAIDAEGFDKLRRNAFVTRAGRPPAADTGPGGGSDAAPGT